MEHLSYCHMGVSWQAIQIESTKRANPGSVIECNVGIFCSCLMLLPKFLERYAPDGLFSSVTRLWSSKRGSSRRESKGQDSMDSFPLSATGKPQTVINWIPPSGAQSHVEIKATARDPETRAFV